MKKKDLIQVRISSEDKLKLKEIASKKNLTMSDLICNYISELIVRDSFDSLHQDSLEKRILETDTKLTYLRNRFP